MLNLNLKLNNDFQWAANQFLKPKYKYNMGNQGIFHLNKTEEPLRCILVDDEKDNLELLEYHIGECGMNVQVIQKIQNARMAYEILKTTDVDLIFLDIQMPEMTGFQILEKLEVWDFHVVFVTAFDQFAIQALRLSAFDYLLKPVMQDDLNKVIQRLISKRHYDEQRLAEFANDHIKKLESKQMRKRLFHGTTDYIYLELDDIVYFEAHNTMAKTYLKSGDSIYISSPLKTLEEELRNMNFYRLHKSFIINMNEISRLSRKEGLTVIMSNGGAIPISRGKKDEFMSVFFVI
jgi:two-component system, LytTR family, response regulator